MKYTVIMRNICNIIIICQIPGPKLKYSNFPTNILKLWLSLHNYKVMFTLKHAAVAFPTI